MSYEDHKYVYFYAEALTFHTRDKEPTQDARHLPGGAHSTIQVPAGTLVIFPFKNADAVPAHVSKQIDKLFSAGHAIYKLTAEQVVAAYGRPIVDAMIAHAIMDAEDMQLAA